MTTRTDDQTHTADAYGATVALDMVRAAITEPASYAPAACILQAVGEALADAA